MNICYTIRDLESTVPEVNRPAIAAILTDQVLNRLSELHFNWGDLGAEPPNLEARTNAKSFLVCMYTSGLKPDLVTASADSGVGICFKRNGVYADVECFNSGEIISAFIDRSGNVATSEMGHDDDSISKIISRISDFINA